MTLLASSSHHLKGPKLLDWPQLVLPLGFNASSSESKRGKCSLELYSCCDNRLLYHGLARIIGDLWELQVQDPGADARRDFWADA